MRGSERSFSQRAVFWIALLAGASFVLAFVLSGFADDLGDPVSAGPDSFSSSVLGYRGLAEFLDASGFDVHRRRAARDPILDDKTALLLAEPRLGKDPATLVALAASASRQRAPLVVVMPKRAGLADPRQPRWVASVVELSLAASMEAVAPLAPPDTRLVQLAGDVTLDCDTSWSARLRVRLRSARLFEPSPAWRAVVSCPEGVLVAHGAGVLFVSDPDLLNNLGLAEADHAQLVQGVLASELGVRAVVFDETIHGHVRNSGLVAELLRYPLVLAVIHGCLLLGLVVWSGIGRFGSPLRLDATAVDGKQALIESTSQLLLLSSRPADLLRDYYRQTLRAAADHFNLPPDLSEDQMLERLGRIGRVREARNNIAALEHAVRDLVRQRPKRPESSLRLARRLHAWRREMMRVD